MTQKNLLTAHILTVGIFLLVAIGYHSDTVKNRLERKYDKIETHNKLLKLNYEINGIDSRLLEALIHIESSGRPNVVSNKQAIGLMQVVYKWHYKRCNLTSEAQLFEPDININCGTEVLKHYLKVSNNNIREALAMYNGGYRKPRESYVYADKVLELFTKL